MAENTAPFADRFDKATLITGGSKGIGSGCARVFVRAGAPVVICDIDEETGRALAAELAAAGPGTCHFEPCDVRRPEQLERVIERTASRFGRLDCLINNAGQHPPHQPIDGFSVEAFRQMLEMNLVSVFAACKYALPHLRKRAAASSTWAASSARLASGTPQPTAPQRAASTASPRRSRSTKPSTACA